MISLLRRNLRVGLLAVAAIVGFAHPGDIVAGGALFGAGCAVAAVIRRRHDQAEQALDVAMWIETQTFPSDTAGDVVEQLRGTSIAELRSSVTERSFFAGMMAERDLQRSRRSAAAKRGTSRRRAVR